MSEMGSERMRQAHLTIRKLVEIAVRKRGRFKIREQPIFDVGPDRLDRVESQRCSAIDIGMNHTDARIEALGEQRYRHFRFKNGVEVIEEGIPGRRYPGGFCAQ